MDGHVRDALHCVEAARSFVLQRSALMIRWVNDNRKSRLLLKSAAAAQLVLIILMMSFTAGAPPAGASSALVSPPTTRFGSLFVLHVPRGGTIHSEPALADTTPCAGAFPGATGLGCGQCARESSDIASDLALCKKLHAACEEARQLAAAQQANATLVAEACAGQLNEAERQSLRANASALECERSAGERLAEQEALHAELVAAQRDATLALEEASRRGDVESAAEQRQSEEEEELRRHLNQTSVRLDQTSARLEEVEGQLREATSGGGERERGLEARAAAAEHASRQAEERSEQAVAAARMAAEAAADAAEAAAHEAAEAAIADARAECERARVGAEQAHASELAAALVAAADRAEASSELGLSAAQAEAAAVAAKLARCETGREAAAQQHANATAVYEAAHAAQVDAHAECTSTLEDTARRLRTDCVYAATRRHAPPRVATPPPHRRHTARGNAQTTSTRPSRTPPLHLATPPLPLAGMGCR